MEAKFRFNKTFRYEVNEPIETVETVLYVLHGYGQQAKYFIRKFQKIEGSVLVVAPEGMHRFYLQGTSGRVGASWMTKEAREDDISDNIEWLNALDDHITEKYAPKRKLILGFSQGGATAARWNYTEALRFEAMILWACVFPPDLDQDQEIVPQGQLHFAIGSEDEFYQGADQNELLQFYQEKDFETYLFEGKHDIHMETLEIILNRIKYLSNKR